MDGVEASPGPLNDGAQAQLPAETVLARIENSSGNVAFMRGLYGEAIHHYTKAIALRSDSTEYYGNRSYCLLLLHRYKEAIDDAEHIVKLDSKSVRGLNRLGQCYLALGDVASAMSFLEKAQSIDPNYKKVQNTMVAVLAFQKSQDAFHMKDYRSTICYLDQAQERAIATLNMKIKKAECLSLLGFWYEATQIVDAILQYHGSHIDALYLRGLCFYHQDFLIVAAEDLQQVLLLQPGHEEATITLSKTKKLMSKLVEGQEALSKLNIPLARNVYAEALTIDVENRCTNSKLYNRLARVEEKLGHFDEAVDNFTASLQRNERSIESYMGRGIVYKRMGRFEEACQDFEKALELKSYIRIPGHVCVNMLEAKVAIQSLTRRNTFHHF